MSITLGTALALAAVSGALQGGSMAIGSRQASKQNKKNEDLIKGEKRQAELDRKNAGNNYLDTIEGRTTANEGAEAMKEAMEKVSNNVIKRGGTTEQRLAEAGSWQKAYGNLLSRLASKGTQWRQENDNILNQARRRYSSAMQGINSAKAQSTKNAWENVGNAMDNVVRAGMTMKAMGGENGQEQVGNNVGNAMGNMVEKGVTKGTGVDDFGKKWEEFLRNKRKVKFDYKF